MNERIEELMVQAGITTNLETDLFDSEGNIGKWLDHFAEEFAELIVRECGHYVDPISRKFLFKHFGVES